MEERKETGALTDEELENVNAGMVIGTTGETDPNDNRTREVIKHGKHTTVRLTCWICGASGTMDQYVWRHKIGTDTYPTEDIVVVCRACGQVPENFDRPGYSSGC